MGREDGFFVNDSGTLNVSLSLCGLVLQTEQETTGSPCGEEEICGEKMEFWGLIPGYVILRSHFVTLVVLDVLLFSAHEKCLLLPPSPTTPPVSLCRFMKPAPMFLDRNFKRLAKVSNYLPPFGFKTQGKKDPCHHLHLSLLYHQLFFN